MALPVAWNSRVLERTYHDDGDRPLSGTVTFTPMIPYVEYTDEATAWFTRPRKAILDGAGKVSISVQTADPDMRQSAYTHRVDEALTYPDVAGQPTPGPVTNTYYILVEPGADPLLYGSLAPIAPSAGVTTVDPLFIGPPGADGADGPPGADGADGADGPPGADGSPGVGLSAFQDWQAHGHPGATFDDFIAYLAGLFSLLPMKNGSVALTPTTDQFLHLGVVDDGTDTSGWKNRFEVSWTQSGHGAHLTFWLNEYGEWRAVPAKTNTTAGRIFVKDLPTDTDHDPTVPVFEIVDNRTDRVRKFAVMPDGTVVGANIGQKIVAQGTAPADTTVIWVDTSA